MTKIAGYIITIEARPERVEDARDLAASLEPEGLFDEVSIHPAIYWKNKASVVDFLRKFPRHTFTESYLEKCLMGQLATTLSHISAWRRLLASKHDAAVIFEDDVHVTDMGRFRAILDHLRENPTVEWARLNLFKTYRDQIIADGKGSILIDDPQPWGFAAYYVTRSGAEKLLDHARAIDKPVDCFPPQLTEWGVMAGKTVTEVVVEHHEFEGDPAELEGRAETEKQWDKLQRSASAIYTSPKVSDDAELHRFLVRMNRVHELRENGVTVLRGVFDRPTIAAARERVLANRRLFRNTRPTASAGHLAGFHRFPALEPLHAMLTGSAAIVDLVGLALRGDGVRTIGLTDITVNRSQEWHVDLLRGKFERFLTPASVWGPGGGGVYKALLYLNDSTSLQVAKGSHLQRVSLTDDGKAVPDASAEIVPVAVHAGDVVVMDLRCRHRGAPEEAYSAGQWDADPRILVSTVFGGAGRELTRQMEIGNFIRMMEWAARTAQATAKPSRPARAQPLAEEPLISLAEQFG